MDNLVDVYPVWPVWVTFETLVSERIVSIMRGRYHRTGVLLPDRNGTTSSPPLSLRPAALTDSIYR